MILLHEQELTHYRVPVFTRLQEALNEELVVVHGPPQKDSHLKTVGPDEQLPFAHVRIRGWWWKGTVGIQDVSAVARRYDPDAVIMRGAVRIASTYALIAYYKKKGVPLLIWGEGFSSRRDFDPGNNPLDMIHVAVVRSADAYVCYSEDVKSELGKYVDPERLYVANNTVDVDRERQICSELSKIGRLALRRKLGLCQDTYLVFIGRLQERKRIDDLLKAVAHLRDTHGLEVGLLVIGQGSERRCLEGIASRLELDDQVSFLGERYGREAGKYLYVADIMVMPGALGLAVNHAFAYGLPVVAYGSGGEGRGKCEHGPESAHVVHGQTGWWAEPDVPEQLAKGVLEVLAERKRYAKTVREYAEQYLTLDRMVEGFVEALKYARKGRAPERSRGTW